MKYFLNVSLAFIAVGTLAGCDMYAPSYMNENQVQVSQEMVVKDILIADIDDEFIGSLARHYSKHGGSPMDVVVTYDPASYRNTAMRATNEAADIASSLRDYGVSNINAGVLPVKSQGDNAYLLVSYNAFNAHAPKGCDVPMSGLGGELKGGNPDYKLGCSTKEMLARQIAKPAHLLGRGANGGTTDGRSATNIIDVYRSGAQNKPLDGESASGN